MGHAVRNTAGAQRVAKIGSEDAIVPKASVEVDCVHASQQVVNVTQMSAAIAGLVVEMVPWESHQNAEMVNA